MNIDLLTMTEKQKLFLDLKDIFDRFDYDAQRAVTAATYTIRLHDSIIEEEYEDAAYYRDKLKHVYKLEDKELSDRLI